MALALLSPLMAASIPNLFVQTKTEITRANAYIFIFYTSLAAFRRNQEDT